MLVESQLGLRRIGQQPVVGPKRELIRLQRRKHRRHQALEFRNIRCDPRPLMGGSLGPPGEEPLEEPGEFGDGSVSVIGENNLPTAAKRIQTPHHVCHVHVAEATNRPLFGKAAVQEELRDVVEEEDRVEADGLGTVPDIQAVSFSSRQVDRDHKAVDLGGK